MKPQHGFRQAYRAHYGFVWHALHRFGVGPASLEDATQDTFLIAHRRWETRRGASLEAWLYGIARRVASNYRRAATRQVRKVTAFGHLAGVVRTAPQPGRAHETIVALDAYLRALPHTDRELFVLSELEGLTGREIARMLGTNVNTTYGRLRKLRTRLEHDGSSRTLVQRAAQERPQATARSWALLVPLLGDAPLTMARFAPALLSQKLVGFAIGACAAGGVVTIASQADVAPRRTQEARAERTRSERAGSTSSASTGHGRAASDEPPPAMLEAPDPAPAHAHVAPAVQLETDLAAPPSLPSAPRATRRPLGPADDDQSLAAQTTELRRASVALRRGDAAAALSIVTAQEQAFPEGELVDVRTALHVEALCALGREGDARGAVAAFVGRHPSSPVIPRMKRSCAHRQQVSEPDTSGV